MGVYLVMTDMKQIHAFAVKWSEKFRKEHINYIELVDHYMADDCEELDFKMDCGKAFEKLYGEASNNCRELDKVIEDVTDINLLGSAIYSRWRYFNQVEHNGEEILELRNRMWFIMALNRLSELSE